MTYRAHFPFRKKVISLSQVGSRRVAEVATLTKMETPGILRLPNHDYISLKLKK